ncbi:MAG: GNAT family N-acetyltransferase [Clostridia bacterium]|nr:GNAT family N-acetyltransferase [Clostridia bacterium]
MRYKEISLREFDQYASGMFSILASNMLLIHPEESVAEDDFTAWKTYQQEHFSEKTFIVFEDGGTLAGYFQYSLRDHDFFIEEIEIRPDYQVRYNILGSLLRFVRDSIPDHITTLSAYINKDNPRSYRVAETLGLSVVLESASGKSLLYSGDIRRLLNRNSDSAKAEHNQENGETSA